MLCMFAMVFKCFQVFLQVFQKHVSSVSSTFRHMLQGLHLNVSKVDRGVSHGIHVGLGFRDPIIKA